MLKKAIIVYLITNTLISLLNLSMYFLNMYTDVSLLHLDAIYIYFSVVCNLFFYFKVRLLPTVIFVTILYIYTNICFILYTKTHYILINNIVGISFNVFYFFLYIYNQNLLIKSSNTVKDTLSNKSSLSPISPKSTLSNRVYPFTDSNMETLIPKSPLFYKSENS